MKKYKGIFITFEGGEGTGKSTVSHLVKTSLEKKDINVFLTREPGGNGLSIAEDIRKLIMKHGDIDPITELLLFNASRREHITKKINPEIKKGNVVISDRFTDSSIIYQGIIKKIPSKQIEIANKIATQEKEPDYVFVFDLEPEIGLKRILQNNRKTNRFDNESLETHKKIRKAYLELAKSDKNKYILIDATKKAEDIANSIVKFILKEIKCEN